MVLVVVVVVISLLALGALTFSELMMAEREGAEVAVAQSQARALAESGAEMARFFVAQDADTQTQAGGWYDNSQKFRGVAVTNEGGVRGTGRFTLIAPSVGTDGRLSGIRFGLEDESARLNLNTVLSVDADPANQGKNVGRQMLMALPGMREDIADAILDWMDLDDVSREYGAEDDVYASLSPPYATPMEPLKTLEELLLVRDVTPALFFGYDMNRNYLVDRSESNAPILIDADNSDGAMNCGWSAYLTASSKESNLRPDGEAKIDLNQEDLKALHEALDSAVGTEWANFIVAYRQYGPYTAKNQRMRMQEITTYAVDLDTKPKDPSPITKLLDLIARSDQVLSVGGNNALESPFPEGPVLSATYLPKLLENCTVGSSGATGRVNVNLAPRVVLSAILCADPDLAQDTSQIEQLVDDIVAERPQDPTQADEEFKYETWIYTRGIVTLDQMKKLIPYVCAGGAVYRTQAVGYFDNGGPSARIEVVIDATSSPPSIVSWREMTHLGRGYPLETLGIEAEGP